MAARPALSAAPKGKATTYRVGSYVPPGDAPGGMYDDFLGGNNAFGPGENYIAPGGVPSDFRQLALSLLWEAGVRIYNPDASDQVNAYIEKLWNANPAYQEFYYNAVDRTGGIFDPSADGSLTAPGTALAKMVGAQMTTNANPELYQETAQLKAATGATLTAADTEAILGGGVEGQGTSSIRNIVVNTALKHGVDPMLALAVVWQESGGDPNRVGDEGHSVGLFQLHDQGMGAGMGDSRYDAQTNAEKGIESLAETMAAHPDIKDPGILAVLSQRPALTVNGQNIGWSDDPNVIAQTDAYKGYSGWYNQFAAGKLPTVEYGSGGGALGGAGAAASKGNAEVNGLYKRYFGTDAPVSVQNAILSHGSDVQAWEDYIRSLPSHLTGITMGQYTDLRSNADKVSAEMYGHQATDGIVQELFNAGAVNPTEVQRWYNFHAAAAQDIPPATYNAIYGAASAVMQNIYGEPGVDPRHIADVYQANGGQPVGNVVASSTADAAPVPAFGGGADDAGGFNP